jgi:hypothetical protein
MNDWDDARSREEDNDPACRSYSDADAAADLAAYYTLKWSVARRSVLVAALVSLLVLPWQWYASLALVIGALCGVANMLVTMHGSERLVESRSVLPFVLSSFLRLGGFGIVAATLAVRGPWWSLAPFLVGFFSPLALYAISAPRLLQRKP